MRQTYRNVIVPVLSLGLVLVYIVIDRQEHTHAKKATDNEYKSESNKDEMLGKFLKESLATKRVLHIVNASKLLKKMDQPRKKFQFIIEPTTVYLPQEETEQVHWTSIVVVKSALGNKNRRDAIRETWANIKTFDGNRFTTVFLLGQPVENVDAQNKAVLQEHEEFGDILLLELPDTAEHLPEKTLAGMQWVSDSLPSHWIYSSADDDISLHIPNFSKHVNQTVTENLWKYLYYEATLQNLPIICVYSYKSADRPARDPKSKWNMPKDMYPPKYWPPYCRGGWYSMSVQMAGNLYRISRWLTLLHLDDVWITGIMRIRYLAETGCADENYLRNGMLAAAPLADRTDGELGRNLKEDVSTVIVSHAWGNIKGRKVDVPETLRNVWKTWLPSFPK